MRFVSFATPKYHEEAAGLVESLVAHDLDYHVAMLPDRGSWVLNCGRKAEFMLSVWDGEPMCWVDADARVVRQPELLHRIAETEEVAFSEFGRETLSGTVMVAGGRGREFLAEWRFMCQANPGAWDQRFLAQACAATGVTPYALPPEYCFIFDLSRRRWPDAQPVIEHRQASRRLKKR